LSAGGDVTLEGIKGHWTEYRVISGQLKRIWYKKLNDITEFEARNLITKCNEEI
jgi:hypothetical protein